jgi:transposase
LTDEEWEISGRKTLGVVDTLGLLVGLVVVVASTIDNAGGVAVIDRAREKSASLPKVFSDGGFKRALVAHCSGFPISAEVVRKIAAGTFEVLPRRWVVARTWSWLMIHRRFQVDYERDPLVAEGFIWAAHARLLLRPLNDPSIIQRAARDRRSEPWSGS